LSDNIQSTFDEFIDENNQPKDEYKSEVETYIDHDKGHGLEEERIVHISRNLSGISTCSRWICLSFIAIVISIRRDIRTNKVTIGKRYFIGSNKDASAQEIAKAIRRHWGIENELHWVLDIAFREDEARHRAGNCAQNFATLRHFAVKIIKGDKRRRLGVTNSRKRAGWDRDYLVHLLTGSKL
jgi:predicted transposase YbfD/YdcC